MATLFFKLFASYPSVYVLRRAFPAWLKVLSRNFGAILLKKPKNVRDSAPLSLYIGVRDFWLAWVVFTVRPTGFFMCSGMQGGSSLKCFLMGGVLI